MNANLSEFVSHLPIAVYRVTVEGKIVYCNDAFVRLFGFDSQSDLMDTPVIHLYRNKKDRGDLVQAILQRGQVVDVPIAYTHRDGFHIWCAVTAKAVLDDDGMVVFLDGILRNITGEIEDDLTDLKRGVHLNSENLSVFILDVQGRFIKANDAAHRLLAVSKGQLDGKAITDFFPESDRDVFLILLGDIRKMGREEAVLRLRDAMGYQKLIETTAIIMKTEGRAHHVKLIAKDVTERVKIAEESRNIEKFQGVLKWLVALPIASINH